MSEIKPLDDLSPMPFGNKYLGTPMQDGPVWYLHWMHTEKGDCPAVQDYIKRNRQALQMEQTDYIWNWKGT